MKKLLSIIVAGSILFLSSISASANQTDTTKADVYLHNQSNSLETYFSVKESLNEKEDTYGGCYIDDSGNLNIWYVDNLKEYKTAIACEIETEQPVVYRKADYSYAELQNVNDRLYDSMDELGIEVLSIDEFSNRVQVVMADDSYDKSDILEYIGDENVVIFDHIVNEPVDDATYTIRNGSALNAGNCSTAVGAVRNGQYGFITAAHCGNVGDAADYNGVTMGTYRACIYGPNVDVAFIQRSSSPHTFNATNLFTDGTGYTRGSLNYVRGGFPSGTTVTKYGSTTGKTTGKIVSTSVSYTINGTKFNSLVSATYSAKGGDSGGAIKVDSNSGGLGYTYCAGIHKGRYTTSGIEYAVFSDMTLAQEALNFKGYYD
ncbi:MAG: S1 family peptidase [Eubacterium sp.]|nr:S1 family peptidase [Eubacterium sp.]